MYVCVYGAEGGRGVDMSEFESPEGSGIAVEKKVGWLSAKPREVERSREDRGQEEGKLH